MLIFLIRIIGKILYMVDLETELKKSQTHPEEAHSQSTIMIVKMVFAAQPLEVSAVRFMNAESIHAKKHGNLFPNLLDNILE